MSIRRHTFPTGAIVVTLAAGVWVAGLRAQTGSTRSAPGRLTGTYTLDTSRSDNAARVADDATRELSRDDRDRVYDNLMSRLQAPESIAIDVRGRSVEIESSNAPRMSFDADGRDRDEISDNGRAMTTRADLQDDALVVSTTGSRGSDYTVRFEPVSGGLRVTRQLESDRLNRTVSAESFYRRVSSDARWDLANSNTAATRNGTARSRVTEIPEGTLLTARLERSLNSKDVREGDRFRMTVIRPERYRGAEIEGIVSRVDAGRDGTNMAIDVDRVRLSSGENVPITGRIQSVRTPDGKEIRIDDSGRRDQGVLDSPDVKHGAIGAALGAIVGAVAGGGKGAAVGAIAGGAAGTVLMQGRGDDFTLPEGSEVTVATTASRDRYPDR